jgi:hypothetical protein
VHKDSSTGTQDTPRLSERSRELILRQMLNDIQHCDQVEGLARQRKLPSIRRDHLGSRPNLGLRERLLGEPYCCV